MNKWIHKLKINFLVLFFPTGSILNVNYSNKLNNGDTHKIHEGPEKCVLGKCEWGRENYRLWFWVYHFLYKYPLTNTFWFSGYCFINFIIIVCTYYGKNRKYNKIRNKKKAFFSVCWDLAPRCILCLAPIHF